MKRFAVLLYGVVVYAVFFVTFLYLIGFVGNILVPVSLDGELNVPLWQALLTNTALCALFGIQHSVMARKGFKDWLKKYIPEAMERSTFCLFTVFALIAIFLFWQPMGGVLWTVENGFLKGILLAIFALGWALVLASTFAINHFDLFGLRQVWLYFPAYGLVTFFVPACCSGIDPGQKAPSQILLYKTQWRIFLLPLRGNEGTPEVPIEDPVS